MVATGEGIIKLDATGFKSSVQSIKKGFGDVETSATKSMNTVKQKSSEASAGLTTIKQKSAEAATGVKQVGAAGTGLNTIKQKSAEAVSGLTSIKITAQGASIQVKQLAVDATALGPAITSAQVSAVSGFNGLAASATKSMNTVKQKSNEATQAVRQTGDAAVGTGTKLQNLSVQVIGLGQAVTGAAAAWAGYNEQIVALDKQKVAQEQLTVSVRRAEQDLAAAINQGALSVQELTRKTEDLNFMRQNQAIGLDEIATKEKTMQAQLVTLAFTITQTGFFGITTLTTVLNVNQKAWIAAKFATLGFSKAALATAFSMKGLRIAMTLVSSHPLMTIAIIAAGAAMLAYEENVFGLRDALSGLAGTELPTISDSLSGLSGSILPEAEGATQSFGDQVSDTTETINQFNATLQPGSVSALGSFGDALGVAQAQLIPFVNGVFDATGNLIDFNDRAGGASPVMNAWAKAIFAAREELRKQNNVLIISNKLLDDNKKKRTQFSLTDSEATFSDSLRGLTGTFSPTGQQILGFRGEAFTMGGREFRSRITSGSRGSSRGPGVASSLGVARLINPFRALFTAAGWDPDSFARPVGATKNSEAAFTRRLQDLVPLAEAKIQAFNELVAFNPNFANLNLSNPNVDRAFLERKLISERARLISLSESIGLSQQEIISIESTPTGKLDISAILRFQTKTQRELMAATTV